MWRKYKPSEASNIIGFLALLIIFALILGEAIKFIINEYQFLIEMAQFALACFFMYTGTTRLGGLEAKREKINFRFATGIIILFFCIIAVPFIGKFALNTLITEQKMYYGICLFISLGLSMYIYEYIALKFNLVTRKEIRK